MESLIQIFRMNELSIDTRIKIMKHLGNAINNQLGGNITEPLVVELVLALDPENGIKDDEHYRRFVSDRL